MTEPSVTMSPLLCLAFRKADRQKSTPFLPYLRGRANVAAPNFHAACSRQLLKAACDRTLETGCSVAAKKPATVPTFAFNQLFNMACRALPDELSVDRLKSQIVARNLRKLPDPLQRCVHSRGNDESGHVSHSGHGVVLRAGLLAELKPKGLHSSGPPSLTLKREQTSYVQGPYAGSTVVVSFAAAGGRTRDGFSPLRSSAPIARRSAGRPALVFVATEVNSTTGQRPRRKSPASRGRWKWTSVCCARSSPMKKAGKTDRENRAACVLLPAREADADAVPSLATGKNAS